MENTWISTATPVWGGGQIIAPQNKNRLFSSGENAIFKQQDYPRFLTNYYEVLC
jgi:hypothetical protein